MEPITYRLTTNGHSSAAEYSSIISSFSTELLRRSEYSLGHTAKKYRQFLIAYGLEEPRTVEEYTFELLNLGVLWGRYGATAVHIRTAPFRLLARLGEWRKRYPRFKPMIDLLRGFLLGIFLFPDEKNQQRKTISTVGQIERLVAWLEATGDFREDAFRYIRWIAYFHSLTDGVFLRTANEIVQFSDWFESESVRVLGVFTPHVEQFIQDNERRYRWREDRFACLRNRTEYHLNMVGAEIMNRAYRKSFLHCEKKTVLLPGCMRKRSAADCEGIKTAKGIMCTGCEADCSVNKIREMGKIKNFDTMVIPHSSDLSVWKNHPDEPYSAVVGVACLSVLVQGGWELQRNNIPAQCILLNECGCKKHWHAKGFPTTLDMRTVKEVVAA